MTIIRPTLPTFWWLNPWGLCIRLFDTRGWIQEDLERSLASISNLEAGITMQGNTINELSAELKRRRLTFVPENQEKLIKAMESDLVSRGLELRSAYRRIEYLQATLNNPPTK